MPDEREDILQTSKDQKQLQKAAVALARSTLAADHETLARFLQSAGFLGRLDSEADYIAAPGRRLRVSRVLEALSQNKAASAQRTLVALTQSSVFLAEDERVTGLITASAAVRPPPPELVAFWDKHCQPDDGYTPTTITTLVDNGTEPALRLLTLKMADPEHGDDVKIAWMRTRILAHRNDLLLLQSCERMLQGGLPENLRPHLVEVLFDYRPGEWFRPAGVTLPPDRSLAGPEARAQLRKIGEWVLQNMKPTQAQEIAVRQTLEELGEQKP